MCDHCMTIIPTNSVTFHCNQCHDFDLCQNCFDQKIEKGLFKNFFSSIFLILFIDVDYYYRGEKFTVKHTPEHPMEKVL